MWRSGIAHRPRLAIRRTVRERVEDEMSDGMVRRPRTIAQSRHGTAWASAVAILFVAIAATSLVVDLSIALSSNVDTPVVIKAASQ